MTLILEAHECKKQCKTQEKNQNTVARRISWTELFAKNHAFRIQCLAYERQEQTKRGFSFPPGGMFNLTQNATFYNKQINWKKTKDNDKTKNTQIAPECFVFVSFLFFFYGDSAIPNLHLFLWKKTKKQQNRNKLRQSADLGYPSLQRKKQKETHIKHSGTFVPLCVCLYILTFCCLFVF